MKIKLHPYRLEFVFPFRIAHGMRTHTDAVFVELELNGYTAFGEATLPPYLPYTQSSTIACLANIDLSGVHSSFNTADVLSGLNIPESPALAALDMALWTLEAKVKHTTVGRLLRITGSKSPVRTYTISVCDKAEMSERIAYGRECGFDTFKLKLDGQHDGQMLADFRSLSEAPFAVDANQSWADINQAIAFAKVLEQNGCILIEQPFDKSDLQLTKTLREQINIPLIADEACQGLADIQRVYDSFSGINVKLQKCGGISPADAMIQKAKEKGLKVLIGCMSESAIGCSAGEVLSPLCDWNDLDGAYLVKEVPFRN